MYGTYILEVVYNSRGVPLKWGKYIHLIIIALFLCFEEGTFTEGERVVSFENGIKCSVVASYMKKKYAHIRMSFFPCKCNVQYFKWTRRKCLT